MSAGGAIRVLIADDHALVREGLKHLVSNQEDMQVVAEATDGQETLALAQATQPAVVLLDMSMPGWDGITTAKALGRACPESRIIALTRHTDRTFVDKMFQLGAWGYVLKQSSSAELTRAIRIVANGSRYVDQALQNAAEPKPPVTPAPPAADGEGAVDLTRDEERVLRLVAQSYSNSEIARQLTSSVETVADLKYRAMAKARLSTRLHVIRYAEKHGWLSGK